MIDIIQHSQDRKKTIEGPQELKDGQPHVAAYDTIEKKSADEPQPQRTELKDGGKISSTKIHENPAEVAGISQEK